MSGHISHFEVQTGEATAFRRARAAAKAGNCAASGSLTARSGECWRSTKPSQQASITGALPPTSNSQSASMGLAGRDQQETDDGCLGPVDFVAGVAGKIGTVATVAGLGEGDVRVGEEFGSSLRKKADEGVVLGVE